MTVDMHEWVKLSIFSLAFLSLCVLGNFNIISGELCDASQRRRRRRWVALEASYFSAHIRREKESRELGEMKEIITKIAFLGSPWARRIICKSYYFLCRRWKKQEEAKLNGKHKLSCETARPPSSREDMLNFNRSMWSSSRWSQFMTRLRTCEVE